MDLTEISNFSDTGYTAFGVSGSLSLLRSLGEKSMSFVACWPRRALQPGTIGRGEGVGPPPHTVRDSIKPHLNFLVEL